ncbi:hypothetical protein NW766_001673, partial [Fusarium irregulare]
MFQPRSKSPCNHYSIYRATPLFASTTIEDSDDDDDEPECWKKYNLKPDKGKEVVQLILSTALSHKVHAEAYS